MRRRQKPSGTSFDCTKLCSAQNFLYFALDYFTVGEEEEEEEEHRQLIGSGIGRGGDEALGQQLRLLKSSVLGFDVN